MTKEQKLLFLKQATKAMDSRWNLSTEIPKIGSGGGDSITINSNPTYTDNRVTNPSHLTQQEVEALIATRIVEVTPKYQPKQIVYQPAPDGLLPIFKLGDYAPQNSKKANMNSNVTNIIYNGVLDLIYVMRYQQLLIYKGADYTLVQSFSTGGNYAESCVSPNGKRLISANNKSYKWDGTKYIEEATLSGVYQLKYLNSDGKSGILYSNRMQLFTINDFGELVRGAYITTQSAYGDEGFSSITPDANYVVVSNIYFNNYIYKKQADGTYIADSQILNADVVKEAGDSNQASVAISIDGTKIALGSYQSGYIYLFNRLADNTWEQQQTIRFNAIGRASGLSFDWKGDKLFCGDYNGGLYVADIVALPYTVLSSSIISNTMTLVEDLVRDNEKGLYILDRNKANWARYYNPIPEIRGGLSTTTINDGVDITFKVSKETTVYMIRNDGWGAFDTTDWEDVVSDQALDYSGNSAYPLTVRKRVYPAGDVVLNTTSSLYVFKEVK